MNPSVLIVVLLAGGLNAAPDGAALFQTQCAACHGSRGEGVAGKVDEPLQGKRSLAGLAKYIDRFMPEDHPEKCQGDDANRVAEWIFGAFYSPAARANAQAPRLQLSHLTNEQYRQTVADLFGLFTGRPGEFTGGGLEARYFNAEKMEQRKEHLVDRIDSQIVLDPAVLAGVPKLKPGSFSVTWTGSLFAPETGDYGFRGITENGVKLFLNPLPWREGREEVPVIDGWVSRGDQPRIEEARLFLTGGRPYPVRVQFLAYGQKSASLRFEWKPPGGVWELVPATYLSKSWAPAVAVPTTGFPPDDASQGYERGIAVSNEWFDAVVRASVELADFASQNLDSLAGTKPGAPDRDEKIRTCCVRFAERAFRRPLAEPQRSALLKDFDPENPETTVRELVMRVLCSPRFLYPLPPGAPTDGFATAASLALSLWDSVPDEPLWQAAAKDRLTTAEQIGEQARRMLANPRARHKLNGFFRHWLALGGAERMAKDPKTFPSFDEHLIADLAVSLGLFLDEVVWNGNADYRDLLLADFLHVSPRMAAFYGLPPVAGEGFTKVSLPTAQRAGVLTHPYLMASLAYYKSSSPIHRGVFVTRNVLGRTLKPPPMAIEFMDDRFDPSLTMREKVTQLTSKPACMSCHELINPLGFSLENFDAAGRWRDRDAGKPVDPTGSYPTTQGESLALRGPRDLATQAIASPEASRSFLIQLFQHTVKQAPQAYGPDTVDQLHASFTTDQYHIRNLLARIAATAAAPQPNPATP
ncbi:MAG: DUF1592 domain-containing protein [Akkermansiaceae bacterium]|nr:DUF1592 domain-containing protein [Akkermansiaceae bacterium]MCF7732448.1 DUF1592 domain-containing protein [Akkermansiaceae bacterium]